MRAVNLLPGDVRGHGAPGGIPVGKIGPMHIVLGALVVVLAYVTFYVITNNTISQRKTQVAALQQQVSNEKVQIARLNSYTQFAQLAQQRAQTVKQIANSRFDWHGVLSDLSKVMPGNASLQSLLATVAPGVSVSGAGGSVASSSISNVRGDVAAPAFELKGCTASQDDVARLISRLRLINDVQRVTLEDSAKPAGNPAGGSNATPTAGGGATGGTCPHNGPTFDMVVFFQPLAGALPTASGAQQASTSTASSAPAGARAAK